MDKQANGGQGRFQSASARGGLALGGGQHPEIRVTENIRYDYPMVGILFRYKNFTSKYVPSRPVEVWLPPGYRPRTGYGTPVIYMHDGQNLFEAAQSFGGVAWEVDNALARLIGDGRVPPTIIVGIWNRGDERYQEYMPQQPLAGKRGQKRVEELGEPFTPGPRSDAYLRFIVEELKPFIDSNYNTLGDPSHTTIMGSSMGGLASIYALCEYPDVFGRAGCLSTHWPAPGELMLDYLRHNLPPAGRHRLYFDLGNRELDRTYIPWQAKVDEIVRAAGYRRNVDWRTGLFKGAGHHERDWRKRVKKPLRFLLQNGPGAAPGEEAV